MLSDLLARAVGALVVSALALSCMGDKPSDERLGMVQLALAGAGGAGGAGCLADPDCAVEGDCMRCDTTSGVCVERTLGENVTCRAASGTGCDVAEVCAGGTDCPPDAVQPNTFVCRAAVAGGCDRAETCDGGSKDCGSDVVEPSNTVCRAAAAGGCDVAESCTGSSNSCPADAKRPLNFVCRAIAMGSSCDVAEVCPGNADLCPSDGFKASNESCRAAVTGGCDLAESCTGLGPSCPADVVQVAGTECRAAAGVCDAPESCTGTNACPADLKLTSAQICRAANPAAACDQAESCSGTSDGCPADIGKDATNVCRAAAAGGCDIAEFCAGLPTSCPADSFQPSTQQCRASAGFCNPAEFCTGSSAACPGDGTLADGVTCNDNPNKCFTDPVCQTGVCVGTTLKACAGATQCRNAGTCTPATGNCDFTNKSDTTSCSDGVACTVGDLCSSGVCASGVETDSQCTSRTCAAVTCDLTADRVQFPDACRIVPRQANTVCRAPGGVCGLQETCDGTSPDCPADVHKDSTQVCLPASCSNLSQQPEARCDGLVATCISAPPASCGNYACEGLTCRVTCIDSDDCAPSAFCVDNICEPRIGGGEPCDDASQCSTSNANCVDGVCCNEACDGQCEACDRAGLEGTCGGAVGAPHGDRTPCSGDGSACNGFCDGTERESCQFKNPQTECQVPDCDPATDVAVEQAFCDGVGSCAKAEPVSCFPNGCAGTTCRGDCVADVQCAEGAFCKAGRCTELQAPGQKCARDAQCQSGFCTDGVCCEERCNGQCEACGGRGVCAAVTGVPVGVRAACAGGVGAGEGADACAGSCDGTAREACTYPNLDVACREPACVEGQATAAARCTGGGSCPPAQVIACKDGCEGNVCAGDACVVNADCAEGEVCTAGVCAPRRGPGASCSEASDCAAGFCVDGVCCDAACDGQCEACDVVGSVGSCAVATGTPHGGRPPCTDDGSACGGACDGKDGATCQYPTGTVCSPGSCTPGQGVGEAVATPEATCIGIGRCPMVLQQPCGAFGCDANERQCDGDCASDGVCSRGEYCSAGVCVTAQPPGSACQGDDACRSGFCVDGYCCGSACTGRCEACDVPGELGKCSPVEGRSHGARPGCQGGGACAAVCDGTSVAACEFPGTDTRCGEPYCRSGASVAQSSCNGLGQCEAGEQTACASFACAGSACSDECSTDADCTLSRQCLEGHCAAPFLIDAVDEGSCGCAVPGRASSAPAGALLLLSLGLLLSRRRASRRRAKGPLGLSFALLAGVLGLLSPSSAAAQQSLDQPFADGFSLLRFEPAPAGDRFFVVPEGAVPAGSPGLRAQLLGHYTLQAPLVRTDDVTGLRRELVAKQLFVHPGVSWAVKPWLHTHLDVPVVLSQTGEGPTAPTSPALADPRLGARLGLVGDEHSVFAFAPGLDVWLPLGSQANLVGDGSVRVMPRLNVSGEALPFIYAASVGYQVRKHVNTGSLEIGDSLAIGAAIGLSLFDEVLTVGPELHGAWLTESDAGQAFSSRTSPLEVLFGAHARLGDIVLGGGIGPSLSEAPGVAPRAVFSLAYAPRTPAQAPDDAPPPPSDADNDGVWDNDDACPDAAGPSRPDPAQSGCPEAKAEEPKAAPPPPPVAEKPPATPAPSEEPDGDGDGVPDARDACPKEPGVKSSDAKTTGCAAKVATGQVQDNAEITFSGFRALPDGRSLVFVEMTGPVAVEVTRVGQVVEYRLVGAKVPLRNNRNPLLMRDFESSALTAKLVPEPGRKGVRLVLTLRGAVSPKHRMLPRGRGAALEIELPAPQAR